MSLELEHSVIHFLEMFFIKNSRYVSQAPDDGDDL